MNVMGIILSFTAHEIKHIKNFSILFIGWPDNGSIIPSAVQETWVLYILTYIHIFKYYVEIYVYIYIYISLINSPTLDKKITADTTHNKSTCLIIYKRNIWEFHRYWIIRSQYIMHTCAQCFPNGVTFYF